MTTQARFFRRSRGLLLAGLAACGGDGGTADPVPEPGTLVVSLTTPNADDAAILLRITGPGITQVAAANAGQYMKVLLEGDDLTAVLVGDLASGALIRFHVPDVGAVASYASSVLQVANETNALRGSTGGYLLALRELGG